MKSKAGHDKDVCYVVVAEDARYVYVSDGKTKTTEHLKKKSRKHIQPTNYTVGEELRKRLNEGVPVRTEEVKYELKQSLKSVN